MGARGRMPAWGYWHGRHTSSPFLALVGKSGIGRKGTAMFRVRDALGYTLGMDTVNRIRFDGIASGEALVKALLDRSQQTFGVPTGVLFEEEYATFLAASGREGSNLDARMRSAFDGKQLAHRKVGETIFVPEPYYLSGLVAITPEELQAKVARASFKNGSGNRWLWLPVVRRDVRVVSTEPIFPVEIGEALLEAHRATFQTPVRIDPGAGVDDLLGEYDEFLRAESVGLAADMTRRYGVIAFRIGIVHASVERSGVVTRDHILRAIALTEYGRGGLAFIFGDALGDASATHLLRMLLEADDGTLPQWTISKYFIRDPIKRQAAIDDLCRLGVAQVVKTRTKGRTGSLLRLVPRKRDFRDFCALIGIEPNHEIPAERAWPSVGRSAQKPRRSGAEASAEGAQNAQKSATERIVDHSTGEARDEGGGGVGRRWPLPSRNVHGPRLRPPPRSGRALVLLRLPQTTRRGRDPMTVATAQARTAKPKPAITRDRYHRYTYEGQTYPGVTTVLRVLDKSDALMAWASRNTAEAALAQLDHLAGLRDTVGPEGVIKALTARSGWKRDEAAAAGSDIHGMAERIAQG